MFYDAGIPMYFLFFFLSSVVIIQHSGEINIFTSKELNKKTRMNLKKNVFLLAKCLRHETNQMKPLNCYLISYFLAFLKNAH